ncbi:topoisomerase DNA-binding C4 zinc finger domain-containing protein [Pseudidiomarina halophila]|uniref:topoisomerase DNA-binding C4 zinc finger domain-containing protein n=1 Tax=Pseudidiomarina halophila TaxID=1449799 RepID=UPI001F541975|nr:topoisomerase DNA-binding C4 zinc finger domain-containing protein [Pseudidiomarina halophila]
MFQLKQQIEQGRLERSFKTNRDHVRHVRETLNAKASATGNITCPKCGGAMVLRESKRGETAGQQFWGCGAYPKCRGIVQF